MDRDYEKMGIYDLRNYARLMGVKAPTTLKRDELIERINEIIEGTAPKQNLTKKGRPPRHKADSNFMIDMIIPDNLFNTPNDDKYKPFSGENFKDDLLSYYNVFCEGDGSKKTDNLIFSGYFDDYSNDFGIAYLKGYMSSYNRENTIILYDLIEKFGLKRGDFVVGSARFVASKNIMLATNIETINGIQAKQEFERKNFVDIRPIYPKTAIDFSDCKDVNLQIANKICPIAKGSRVAINLKDTTKHDAFVLDMVETLSQNNLKTMVISIDDSPEDIGNLLFKCPSVEVYERRPAQEREQFFDAVDMLMSNSVCNVEYGKDVAIVIYNLNNFYNAMMQNFIITQKMPEYEAKIVALNKIKDMFNLAKNCDSSSLTVIAVSSNDILDNSANCKINLTKEPIDGTDIIIDFETSQTNNLNEILNNEELSKYTEFKNSYKTKPILNCLEKLLA